ncbi:MAG: deoxyuridine 5'-triphosphate nucleotidohydrolase [Eubacteriales bacterium]|nr:deoxyuridine 5'-triphosphate nucleotidohydrolase [Eubacteriales bacterium]
MRIKLIDFGSKRVPKRSHDNDAGLDVYVSRHYTIYPHETKVIPLGFGLVLPDGCAGFIFPRSSLSRQGIICQLPPIDSTYRGEVHAIVSNQSQTTFEINDGDRVGQLVILPIVVADLVAGELDERGAGCFGSTGR